MESYEYNVHESFQEVSTNNFHQFLLVQSFKIRVENASEYVLSSSLHCAELGIFV